MVSLKIDWDYASFPKYLLHFKKMYSILKLSGLVINYVSVFKTKKGYHIYTSSDYIRTNYRIYNKDVITLIECLLGSDLFKQAYAFSEGYNVLFKVKNNKLNETMDFDNTRKLQNIVSKMNKEKVKRLSFNVKTHA